MRRLIRVSCNLKNVTAFPHLLDSNEAIPTLGRWKASAIDNPCWDKMPSCVAIATCMLVVYLHFSLVEHMVALPFM